MTPVNSLPYPVLCLAHDNSVSVAQTPTELQSCNAVAWFRNRYFADLRLFDADGSSYRVSSAELTEPLHGWRCIVARAFNQNLVVVIEVESLGNRSLEAAKAATIEWVRRAPEFWEAAYDLPELEALVQRSPDMEALCAVFA
jgi:hypothetical protein